MTDAPERVTGKIARVVSSRELIINRGSIHGVSLDMIFKVLDSDLMPVKDPDTGEVLGEVKRVKVLVKVVDVSERLCVARTYRQERVNVGGTGGFAGMSELSKMFTPPKYEWITETLEVDPVERQLGDSESLVSVGDPVESLLENEDDDEIGSIALWR